MTHCEIKSFLLFRYIFLFKKNGCNNGIYVSILKYGLFCKNDFFLSDKYYLFSSLRFSMFSPLVVGYYQYINVHMYCYLRFTRVIFLLNLCTIVFKFMIVDTRCATLSTVSLVCFVNSIFYFQLKINYIVFYFLRIVS